MAIKIRKPTEQELQDSPVYDLTMDEPWYPDHWTEEPLSQSEYEQLQDELQQINHNLHQRHLVKPDPITIAPYLLHPGKETVKKTLENTTTLGTTNSQWPMRQHYKPRNAALSRRRFQEGYATDTGFATVTSYEGYNCFQFFYGINSHYESAYGLTRESDGPKALLDFFRQEGLPISLLRDNSKMQSSEVWSDHCRKFWVKDKFIEPYQPNQNPAERDMAPLKDALKRGFMTYGCPPEAWFCLLRHTCDVRTVTARESLGWKTPHELREGETPDISGLLQFQFWELVYYMDPTSSFPDTGGNEKLGRWLGRAKNHGDTMCSYILTTDTEEIIVRGVVRSVHDKHENQGFSEEIKSLLQEDEQRRKDPTFPLIWHTPGDKVENPETGELETRGPMREIHPEDFINCELYDTFLTKTGKETKRKGKVVAVDENGDARVEFTNGSQKLYDYQEIVDILTKSGEDDAEMWEFDEILDHKWSTNPDRHGKMDVLVKWTALGEQPTWEPMETIKKDDPVTLAGYAAKNNLLEKSIWKWAKRYVKNAKKFKRVLRDARLMKKRTGKATKYQFGQRVPRNFKECIELDKLNGDTGWQDAVKKEVHLLKEVHQCFKKPEPGEITEEYQTIPLLWVFAVKFDGRKRARCVAGGHRTQDPEQDMYSGVVDLENVKIVFLIAVLTCLRAVAGDIGSAYIMAATVEKVCTVLGPEFGDWAGILVIIILALYGLKLSGACWHKLCSKTLIEMGFVRSKADYDLWMRAREDHYEYIAVIVDDLLVFSREPESIIEPLKEVYKYELKGVGQPEYYDGADVRLNPETGYYEMSATTYVKNVCEKLEKLYDMQLKSY